jgi:hypothetical protein
VTLPELKGKKDYRMHLQLGEIQQKQHEEDSQNGNIYGADSDL